MRILFAALLFATPSMAQSDFPDVGTITAEFEPKQARPGEVVTLQLTVATIPGWHTYPVNGSQDYLNKLKPKYEAPAPRLIVVGPVVDPSGAKSEGFPPVKEYELSATWTLKVLVSPYAPPGETPFEWNGFRVQVCKGKCFNTRTEHFPPLALNVLPGPAAAIPAGYEAEAKVFTAPLPVAAPPKLDRAPEKSEPKETPKPRAPVSPEEYKSKLDAVLQSLEKIDSKREGGIAALLLTAVFWGFVSLATPCVFPMIPITVSLFLKQANQSAGGAVKLAAIYSLTITVVLGLSAVTLLSVFYQLSVNPITNVVLGLLFIVFALSLFGMYELVLPNFMLRAAESRRKQGGMIGTVFGAIAFSIVSFTCVAPFLGGFAGMVSSGQYSQGELILAGLAFAAAFALPFFVLALFPSLLKRLPKSGGWLDSVKVVMGFLEVAAALKFFRTAELRWSDSSVYFTYDTVMAGWVAVAVAGGLYLLNVYRLPHDEEKPNIGVPRLVFAMMFLGLAAYLAPALWKQPNGESQRPRGIAFAWIDAFLLPESNHSAEGLPWSPDLPGALEKAREQHKATKIPQYVFVDFTGKTCSNCKDNEREVFPQARIDKALRKFSLVQLYTDDVPGGFYAPPPSLRDLNQEGDANGKFQFDAFGTSQLPLYAILEPTPTGAKVVGVYAEGKINSPDKFAEFLEAPFGK